MGAVASLLWAFARGVRRNGLDAALVELAMAVEVEAIERGRVEEAAEIWQWWPVRWGAKRLQARGVDLLARRRRVRIMLSAVRPALRRQLPRGPRS